jgi:uncharacterized protein (TIGR02452 family)
MDRNQQARNQPTRNQQTRHQQVNQQTNVQNNEFKQRKLILDQERQKKREFNVWIAQSNGHYMHSRNAPPVPITYRFKSVRFIKPCVVTRKTKIEFLDLTSDKAALHCLDTGSQNVVIMNFANRFRPGGGYLTGAMAQEEDLCRLCPQLWSSLNKFQYPFEQDDILVTPNVIISRDSDANYEILPVNKQRTVGFVSVAAQDLKREQFDKECVQRTLQNMFSAVEKCVPDTDTLILGAWGCGAFGNDPNIMSFVMNEAVLIYGGYFKRIVFSIPPGPNYDAFNKVILTTV